MEAVEEAIEEDVEEAIKETIKKSNNSCHQQSHEHFKWKEKTAQTLGAQGLNKDSTSCHDNRAASEETDDVILK